MKMGKKKDEKTGIKGEETQQKATYLKEEIKKSSMHAKDSMIIKNFVWIEGGFCLVNMKRTEKIYIFIMIQKE